MMQPRWPLKVFEVKKFSPHRADFVVAFLKTLKKVLKTTGVVAHMI
jgi:hypothetical protein